jgi:lysine 2,3-aminomutase
MMMKVKPYYLYQCDLIEGSGHLRTDPSVGLKIIEELRGFTSGYAIPQFVIDAPGGGGKIPINPNYIIKSDENGLVLKNYEGRTFNYPTSSILSTPKPLFLP